VNVREVLLNEQRVEDERVHPWRYWHTKKVPEYPFDWFRAALSRVIYYL
jgi:hypothetical protein